MAFVPTISVGLRSTFVHPLQIDRPLQCYARPSPIIRTPIRPATRKVPSPTMQTVDVKTSEVFMPALSSTMTEGKIVQWLKRPGDPVASGEPIMVVESDKADMDVESFEDGFLASILVDEGSSCAVGAPVGLLVSNKDDISKVNSSSSTSPASSTSSSPSAQTAAPTTPSHAATDSASVAGSPTVKPDLLEVFMPALSSTMTEGKVVDWLKSEGDTIEQGDMLMVVESDKADMDVESFESGILAHILVPAGGVTDVGAPVAYLARSAADVPAIKTWVSTSTTSTTSTASANGAPTASASSSTASSVSDSVTAQASPAAAPAFVNEGRVIASPLARATAQREGVDLKYVKGTGPNGRIKQRDVFKSKAESNSSVSSGTTSAPPPSSTFVKSNKTFATPDAKKIAKKENIDLSTVTGTGNFGRITADDVLRAAGKAQQTSETQVKVSSEVSAAPSPSPVVSSRSDASREISKEAPLGAVAMNAMQKAVVDNMNATLTVPVFRITYEIRTSGLDSLYAKVKSKGVTMSALLAKAVGITLRKHPIMNAAYENKTTVFRKDINIAMAVATPDGGLITPTLMNVDETDLYSLSRAWKDMVKRAGEKKLSPAEYSSGTFVISNLGMFGVDQFDAILPPGVPGILAVGASKPVVQLQSNGLVGVEKVMKVTLTADHRHIYGADGAKFLQDLAALLENNATELTM